MLHYLFQIFENKIHHKIKNIFIIIYNYIYIFKIIIIFISVIVLVKYNYKGFSKIIVWPSKVSMRNLIINFLSKDEIDLMKSSGVLIKNQIRNIMLTSWKFILHLNRLWVYLT